MQETHGLKMQAAATKARDHACPLVDVHGTAENTKYCEKTAKNVISELDTLSD